MALMRLNNHAFIKSIFQTIVWGNFANTVTMNMMNLPITPNGEQPYGISHIDTIEKAQLDTEKMLRSRQPIEMLRSKAKAKFQNAFQRFQSNPNDRESQYLGYYFLAQKQVLDGAAAMERILEGKVKESAQGTARRPSDGVEGPPLMGMSPVSASGASRSCGPRAPRSGIPTVPSLPPLPSTHSSRGSVTLRQASTTCGNAREDKRSTKPTIPKEKKAVPVRPKKTTKRVRFCVEEDDEAPARQTKKNKSTVGSMCMSHQEIEIGDAPGVPALAPLAPAVVSTSARAGRATRPSWVPPAFARSGTDHPLLDNDTGERHRPVPGWPPRSNSGRQRSDDGGKTLDPDMLINEDEYDIVDEQELDDSSWEMLEHPKARAQSSNNALRAPRRNVHDTIRFERHLHPDHVQHQTAENAGDKQLTESCLTHQNQPCLGESTQAGDDDTDLGDFDVSDVGFDEMEGTEGDDAQEEQQPNVHEVPQHTQFYQALSILAIPAVVQVAMPYLNQLDALQLRSKLFGTVEGPTPEASSPWHESSTRSPSPRGAENETIEDITFHPHTREEVAAYWRARHGGGGHEEAVDEEFEDWVVMGENDIDDDWVMMGDGNIYDD
ncbi:hypothetical protein VTJ49DRAFT_7374 [Mycothermus thermophilus]|uniref:Uncharacterized protein n=1 Tax=Humicola insolens TaxID=85995 RepID=A0ABR3VH05_HUMIN